MSLNIRKSFVTAAIALGIAGSFSLSSCSSQEPPGASDPSAAIHAEKQSDGKVSIRIPDELPAIPGAVALLGERFVYLSERDGNYSVVSGSTADEHFDARGLDVTSNNSSVSFFGAVKAATSAQPYLIWSEVWSAGDDCGEPNQASCPVEWSIQAQPLAGGAVQVIDKSTTAVSTEDGPNTFSLSEHRVAWAVGLGGDGQAIKTWSPGDIAARTVYESPTASVWPVVSDEYILVQEDADNNWSSFTTLSFEASSMRQTGSWEDADLALMASEMGIYYTNTNPGKGEVETLYLDRFPSVKKTERLRPSPSEGGDAFWIGYLVADMGNDWILTSEMDGTSLMNVETGEIHRIKDGPVLGGFATNFDGGGAYLERSAGAPDLLMLVSVEGILRGASPNRGGEDS